MSSLGYAQVSQISYNDQNIVQKQDDAEFFSVANEYNQRKSKMLDQRAMEAMNMIHNFNIKNNPKDPKVSQVREEKTRKTRSDQEGREFTCGACNKSYLSYPALYTHIKTKHGGITPQGTKRGKNNNNKKRGRPKNLRAQPNLHHRPEPEFVFPKEYCKLVDKFSVNFVEIDDDRDDRDQNQQNGEIKIQSQIFARNIRQLKNSTAPLITLPIIKIMSIYLYNIGELIGQRTDAITTIQDVSEKLVKMINQNYNKILNQYQIGSKFFVRKEIPEREIYCEYENCEYLPVFVNQMLKRLDKDNDQMEIDYLTDFCNWLHSKKLTSIRLIPPQALETGLNNNQNQE